MYTTDSIWFVAPDTETLVSPYALYDNSKRIEAAHAFEVTMVATLVGEDLDGFLRGNNDVMVLTRVSFGEQPLVDRVHFYETGISAGTPIRSLYADNIYATDDYSGRDRLRIELNVLEIDTDSEERKVLTKAFQSLEVTASPSFVINQKIATLLTQVHSGNSNSTTDTLNFLKSTLQQYSNYQKLQRYVELKNKTTPTSKEQQLLVDIENTEELKPFLPD